MVDECKQVVRQIISKKTPVRYFDDYNPEHQKELQKYLIKKGRHIPPPIDSIPYQWYESFWGWNFLSRFGRPSAMGAQPMEFQTVEKYVSKLELSDRHQLIMIDQIITIDLEFVNSLPKPTNGR